MDVETLATYGIPVTFAGYSPSKRMCHSRPCRCCWSSEVSTAWGKLGLACALLAAPGLDLADVLWYGVGRGWGDRVRRVAVVGRARVIPRPSAPGAPHRHVFLRRQRGDGGARGKCRHRRGRIPGLRRDERAALGGYLGRCRLRRPGRHDGRRGRVARVVHRGDRRCWPCTGAGPTPSAGTSPREASGEEFVHVTRRAARLGRRLRTWGRRAPMSASGAPFADAAMKRAGEVWT